MHQEITASLSWDGSDWEYAESIPETKVMLIKWKIAAKIKRWVIKTVEKCYKRVDDGYDSNNKAWDRPFRHKSKKKSSGIRCIKNTHNLLNDYQWYDYSIYKIQESIIIVTYFGRLK